MRGRSTSEWSTSRGMQLGGPRSHTWAYSKPAFNKATANLKDREKAEVDLALVGLGVVSPARSLHPGGGCSTGPVHLRLQLGWAGGCGLASPHAYQGGSLPESPGSPHSCFAEGGQPAWGTCSWIEVLASWCTSTPAAARRLRLCMPLHGEAKQEQERQSQAGGACQLADCDSPEHKLCISARIVTDVWSWLRYRINSGSQVLAGLASARQCSWVRGGAGPQLQGALSQHSTWPVGQGHYSHSHCDHLITACNKGPEKVRGAWYKKQSDGQDLACMIEGAGAQPAPACTWLHLPSTQNNLSPT